MGQEAEKAERQKIFMPYQVNGELFKNAADDAVFMHCLPAYRGFEVTEEVIDGPQSAFLIASTGSVVKINSFPDFLKSSFAFATTSASH